MVKKVAPSRSKNVTKKATSKTTLQAPNKASKTPNPITTVDNKPLKVFDVYLDMFTLRQKPISQDTIIALGNSLVDWALNTENAIVIDKFFEDRGFANKDVKRFCATVPQFEVAYSHALSIIGTRREMAGYQGKAVTGFVLYSMPMYKESWERESTRRAKLKETQQDTKIELVIPNLIKDK